MRICTDHMYRASVHRLFGSLTDPGHLRQRALAAGADEAVAEVRACADALTVTVVRTIPTGGFPARFRAATGSHLTLALAERWGPPEPDGSRSASLAGEVLGFPVVITGTLRLEPGQPGPDGVGTTHHQVDADLRVRVPLFGGRVERGAAPVVRAWLDAEAKALQALLAAGGRLDTSS